MRRTQMSYCRIILRLHRVNQRQRIPIRTQDRKSTRLNSSHSQISYAVFCLKKNDSYFNPGFFEDHVVCEYWNAAEQRWVLVDPQLDEVWRKKLKLENNCLDFPRDRLQASAA